MDENNADELLKRALIETDSAVSVALKVTGLPLSESLTVVFHGRLDLGTIQTYVAHGKRGAGSAVSANELLRVPCDLDLGDAEDKEEAERLYLEQATVIRDALVGADTVLSVWREPFEDLVGERAAIDRRIDLEIPLPAPRFMPSALVAADKHIIVTPVCNARSLYEGKPPLGIACAQQDVIRVYPLSDDPERCLENFLDTAAEHARRFGEQLRHQEQSVRRFLEISGEELDEAG